MSPVVQHVEPPSGLDPAPGDGPSPIVLPLAMPSRAPRRFGDPTFRGLTGLFAGVVLVVSTLIGIVLWRGSAQSVGAFGWGFVTGTTWDPVAGEFGALPFVYGTLMTSALALAIAIPLGVGASICLAELLPRRWSDPLTFLVELLVAVPSVVYGLLGVFVLVPLMRQAGDGVSAVLGFLPWFAGPSFGVGLFTASALLALMVVPYIVAVSREVLLAVPQAQRDAALALGCTRWETVWHVVLPYAYAGIFGAVFLALARALGETMAVTMVIGNRPEVAAALLAPAHTMAAVLANEFTEATDDLYLAALIEVAFVLFAITVLINGLARLLLATTRRPGTSRA